MPPVTAAELFLRDPESDEIAAHFEDRSYTRRELVTESRRRAALWERVRDPSAPPHIGVLLDNTAEFLFWLGAAAITRSVVVGINSTYRGAELAQLIDHTDCQVLVTSDAYADLLAAAPSRVTDDRVFVTGTADYTELLATVDADHPGATALDDDLYLLIFTSGTTGLPKAVRCTQGRFARNGKHVTAVAGLGPGSAVYAPLPIFHSSFLFTGLASALEAQVPIATRAKFSASRTMPDIRRTGSTMLAYTGKVLNYILAVPPSPDDASSPLVFAFGNEASESDIRDFAARFDCQVRDSYGSTEGMVVIRRDASMPSGSLGRADDNIAVYDPERVRECPRAEFDAAGRLLNADVAVGEIVNTEPADTFEGYYRNEEATRRRSGMASTGPAISRTATRMGGSSSPAARTTGCASTVRTSPPVRSSGSCCAHPAVRSAAVYAVPDDPVGDRVMVAVEVDDLDGVRRRRVRRLRGRAAGSRTEVGPELRAGRGRVAQAGEHEARQDRVSVATAGTSPGVSWRPKRGEPMQPMTPTDVDALAPLRSGHGGRSERHGAGRA